MVFNSPVFLFFFFPISLLIYYAVDRRFKNLVLLAASLIFFAWGNLFYFPVLVLIIIANFFLAQLIERSRAQPQRAKRALLAGTALNLILLIFFKLAAGYGTGWLSFLPPDILEPLAKNPLPLGLSYITFQVISYLFDVTNEIIDSEKNFVNYSLYIMLFPKIIVGPIVRYRDVAQQLASRQVTGLAAANGARRFILGLAKKALIADTLARIVNPAFALSSPSFSTGTAWLVLVGYALQLYFDFSGYSDMAIGLGQMLGFRFMENFNYPYISRSIGEFWRRWHISLSSWFRDYVFYPLELTRRKADPVRQQAHILIVFLLTGLWHGLTLNFVIWGLIHGLAIALETAGFGRRLKKAWAPLQHGYTLLVILAAWVFFRSPGLEYAGQFFARLVGSRQGLITLPFSVTQPLPIIEPSVWLALAAGVLFSLPVLPAIRKAWQPISQKHPYIAGAGLVSADLLLLFLLISAAAAAVGSSYVASIYGGF